MLQGIDTSRQELLDSLRGQELHVPDLEKLFCHWPQCVNADLPMLREDVEAKLQACVTHPPTPDNSRVDCHLQSLFPEGERLRKMRAADTALFGASWWPYASLEPLRIATYLSIWVRLQLCRVRTVRILAFFC